MLYLLNKKITLKLNLITLAEIETKSISVLNHNTRRHTQAFMLGLELTKFLNHKIKLLCFPHLATCLHHACYQHSCMSAITWLTHAHLSSLQGVVGGADLMLMPCTKSLGRSFIPVGKKGRVDIVGLSAESLKPLKIRYYPSGVQFRNYIEPEITQRPLRGQEGYPSKRGAGNTRSLGGVCASPNRPSRS